VAIIRSHRVRDRGLEVHGEQVCLTGRQNLGGVSALGLIVSLLNHIKQLEVGICTC